jgi:hypothetical protein
MKITGQYAKVMIDVDGTEQQVMELREWSVSAESEKISADVAGNDWSEHLIGRKSWEGEATCISADQYWLPLMDKFVTVKFFDHQDDLEPAYEGEVSLNFERTTPHDDVVESTLSFTGNGALRSPKSDSAGVSSEF